jgi:glycosyltransferase involved in cell wall biosynthesis
MGLRILIVSDHYPPFIGGAHRQTQLLGRKLRQRGHQVSVATVWQPGLPDVQDDEGVAVHRLRQLRALLPSFARGTKQRHQPPFADPITVWQLRKLISRFKPDVVHSYGWFSYSCAAALLGKDIPLLISARDYAYSCATRTLVRNGEHLCSGPEPAKCLLCAQKLYGAPKGWLAVLGVYTGRALLKRKLSGMHSISSYVRQIVRRDFLEPVVGDTELPQVVIPSFREEGEEENAAPLPNLDEYLRGLPREPFILFVGALRHVKGLEQLLKAYEQLVSPPPLVLIGTIEPDTPRNFPEGVVILQNFPHQAVMAAWERCLFGVVPSLWPEPLGSVVYEGMSQGKAVIGTTPGGHTDMILDRETGLLVPQGDVEALVKAMRELLENPELRERLGCAARERAKMFTADVAVPRFESMYQQLARASGGNVNDMSAERLKPRQVQLEER